MIKGLIFDFDGLILDTESPECAAWIEIFTENGAHLDPEEWAACLGTYASAFNAVGLLEERSGRLFESDAITVEYHRRAIEKINKQPILDGIVLQLEAALNAGMQIAIASSSPRDWVTGHLERLGLTDYFSCLVTRDDVKTVKPDPELYLLALERMGLMAHEAIALEDSPNGVTAARKAGLYCIAVPNPISQRLDLSHASLIIPSLADVSLAHLVEKVNNHLN
jgi:HAD superfamily hydrolase (TIGR01509 family)